MNMFMTEIEALLTRYNVDSQNSLVAKDLAFALSVLKGSKLSHNS